ncbi:hypothetical protein BA895_21005 [Humibacillus sp. DSM 29435]|uniref:TetR/AcrR family transcriptional regulator n=1 Tax=Humibacillus sp. DSM 29435 TaxID=1869167 RepID=UPI000872E2A0|nr:TetR/AcrR family transcriptional regulator [Humibacillus sp. DSM 29435]OFE15986.1 hypothetical protein BA895_21005 [Humibacillus sp. DSM 29435]
MSDQSPRTALLHKAIVYYAEHGVRDTSLRTLAAAIGTSQRMLHYHFGSREDVLAVVLETVVAEQIRTLDALFAECDDPFEAGLRNWQNAATSAQTFGPLFFELASHAMYGQAYAAHFADVVITQHVRAFGRAYAGVAEPAQADALARLTLAVGQGLLFGLLLDGDRRAADAAVLELIDMVRGRVGGEGPVPGEQGEQG